MHSAASCLAASRMSLQLSLQVSRGLRRGRKRRLSYFRQSARKSGTHLLSRLRALPLAAGASRCCSGWEAVLPPAYLHQNSENRALSGHVPASRCISPGSFSFAWPLGAVGLQRAPVASFQKEEPVRMNLSPSRTPASPLPPFVGEQRTACSMAGKECVLSKVAVGGFRSVFSQQDFHLCFQHLPGGRKAGRFPAIDLRFYLQVTKPCEARFELVTSWVCTLETPGPFSCTACAARRNTSILIQGEGFMVKVVKPLAC